jgi:hypothetical protein
MARVDGWRKIWPRGVALYAGVVLLVAVSGVNGSSSSDNSSGISSSIVMIVVIVAVVIAAEVMVVTMEIHSCGVGDGVTCY